ncbi:TlpA family protein disulfide reductase [Chitinophaga sp. GCM10012297]|uniref:TlpA family protein disulfide reductase n=1 Tax=Chitinophaga chungangae TaxID=2821488 RepID=A0ABS3Y9D5_9BACT|nr:TlpA disulfide reductase family protein [Chitinophaga chungangae]MBO9151290.1 TlpA family protein disulfide reductase [Chitinophaga chungangae]
MKTICCLALLLPLALRLPAQFTLGGKTPQKGDTLVQVNTPVVYGFNRENTVDISIGKTGTFNVILPVKGQKFVSLIYRRQFYTLLLTEGKDLRVEPGEKTLRITGGTASPENRLLQQLDMDTPPFFMSDTSLAKLSPEALKEKVLQPFMAKQEEKFRLINASNISARDKKLVASEVKYLGYNYLSDFARTQLRDRETINAFVIEVFDHCMIDPEFVPAGPQYYAFADNYLRYLETKAFVKIRKENIPPGQPIPYFGISLDSANTLVQKYGKPYWRWIGSLRHFPQDVTETYTFQEIKNQYYDKDLNQAQSLASAFMQRFPKSRYNSEIRGMVAELQNRLSANNNNENIVLVKDYNNVRSIYEVIKPLKGKVVYLDVWGTWCGPCKEELKHLPGLKAAFAGKDVAFVYLDMDDESRDALWKNFIRVNDMEGVHLRKNRHSIAPFWKELLAGHPDKAEYYPQYFLFDKNGKLVVSKARTPSEKGALYEQINAVLNNKSE